MFDSLLEVPTFLKEFIPKPVTPEEALWVFGDHLSERVKIHAAPS
jgi:hypothetical protein